MTDPPGAFDLESRRLAGTPPDFPGMVGTPSGEIPTPFLFHRAVLVR
jgi:hypothetical protein